MSASAPQAQVTAARVAGRPAAAPAASLHVPFAVGTMSLAIPYGQVARVTLPAGVARLARYANLPAYVVGVAAIDAEMLTVVDAGLLFGLAPIHHTLKTRLIVLGDGPMKGFALLVSRVLDMVPFERLSDIEDLSLAGADALSNAMAAFQGLNGVKQ